jgi:hypothetical protein
MKARMAFAVIIAEFVCSASTCDRVKPSKAIDAHCEAACFEPCAALTGWDGDRDGQRLGTLMDLHDAQHQICDGQRALCAACIQTARKAGAIQ